MLNVDRSQRCGLENSGKIDPAAPSEGLMMASSSAVLRLQERERVDPFFILGGHSLGRILQEAHRGRWSVQWS